jgi:hypothetical protein
MIQTAASSCLRKPTSYRLKRPSSPANLVSSLLLSLPESRLSLWSNLLASTSPRPVIPQRPTVSCPPHLMPTNSPAPIASSSSRTIQLLRLAIPPRPVQLAHSRNKEGRARRESEKPTGKPRTLAKADPNPTLHRLSLISNPNQYHRHSSLHSLPCNPRVLARTSYHQTLRSFLSRDKLIIRSPHLPNLQLCTIVGMVYLLPLSSELRPLAGMPDLEEATKTCVA